ncbi:hypothetical protein FO522_30415 [Bacillus nitratireducens]|nr:hypothetical protein [Bacillus nitratireducens]
MPAFIKSTKDNKKLYGKTAFCLKIYLKLMDVWRYPYMYFHVLGQAGGAPFQTRVLCEDNKKERLLCALYLLH